MEKLTVAERIARRVVVDQESGCHVWQGACTKDGYGQIRVGKRILYVHRVAYELHVGRPIKPLHDLDHLKADRAIAPGPCKYRNCCNPEHVEEVHRTVNRGVRMRKVKAVC